MKKIDLITLHVKRCPHEIRQIDRGLTLFLLGLK